MQGCPIAVRQPSWGQVWCVGPGEVEQSYLHSHGHREWLRAMPKGENPPGTANGFEPCPDAIWACDTPPMEKGAWRSEGRRGEDRGGRNGGGGNKEGNSRGIRTQGTGSSSCQILWQ